MARTHYVQKARRAWACEKCRKQIEIGQPYKWVAPRSGPWEKGRKRTRCEKCPAWKQSELTTSKMAGVYAAQEGFSEFMRTFSPDGGLEELEAELESFADEVDTVADEYQESADNIEQGFQHPTSQSEELVGKADSLRDWAGEIRSAFSDIDQDLEGDDLRAAVEDAVSIADECPA